MIKAKKRYSLFTVFWVVLVLNIVFTIIGLLAAQLTPEMKTAANHVFTAPRLLKQALVIIFETLFYYFSLNYFNQLIVEKRKAIYYIGYSLLLFVIMFGFYSGENYLLP